MGDRIVSVDGRSVHEPAFQVARRLTFKAVGQKLTLTLRRAGETIERSYILDRAPEPEAAPHSPNPFIGIHPLMNWRGIFVPCMGAGPLGPAVILACTSKMEHDGFIKTNALGDPDLLYDENRPSEAFISSATAAAAAADVRRGDVVTAVDGRTLTSDIPTYVATLLFGRAGETKILTVEHAGRLQTRSLVLDLPA